MSVSKHFPICTAEQPRGGIAYLCILAHGHDGPHGRLVPEATWWIGDDRVAIVVEGSE